MRNRTQLKHLNQRGFTLVEISMVILLVAILAIVAIPQFINFKVEATNAATYSALGALRIAIVDQISQMQIRCEALAGKFPATASLIANDVTDASNNSPTICGVAWPAMVAAEKKFMSTGIPPNPWSKTGTVPGTVLAANAIETCGTTGCDPITNPTIDCTGTSTLATAADVGGWCYDPTKGTIWPNSANNGSAGTKENAF